MTFGATASGITGTNTPNSRGSTPSSANAAASGLTVNDGANNLGAGNFQFGTAFTAETRFFIVESALASGTMGDDTVITKLGAVTFSLADLGVTHLTSISTATGIRLVSSALDPNVVGLYTVP